MFALYQAIPQAPAVCLFVFKGQGSTWVTQFVQAGPQQISQSCFFPVKDTSRQQAKGGEGRNEEWRHSELAAQPSPARQALAGNAETAAPHTKLWSWGLNQQKFNVSEERLQQTNLWCQQGIHAQVWGSSAGQISQLSSLQPQSWASMAQPAPSTGCRGLKWCSGVTNHQEPELPKLCSWWRAPGSTNPMIQRPPEKLPARFCCKQVINSSAPCPSQKWELEGELSWVLLVFLTWDVRQRNNSHYLQFVFQEREKWGGEFSEQSARWMWKLRTG